MQQSRKAILLGLLAAVFFSATYIFNKSMANSGGDFLWSASLRYLITLPIILFIVFINKGLKKLIVTLMNDPMPWLIWGTVGFGFFYLFLTAAASISPAWLVAGTFQLTILSGLLISPFIYKDHRKIIPKKALQATSIILFGVILSQIGEIKNDSPWRILLGGILIFISATLFPLGNRMIMLYQEKQTIKLDAFQRVAGMTLGSIPLWIIVSLLAYYRSGFPPESQIIQSGIIAICSTVIATAIFFKATAMAGNNPEILGAVEATQSIEIIVTLIAEIIFLNGKSPSIIGYLGILLISFGMLFYSKISTDKKS